MPPAVEGVSVKPVVSMAVVIEPPVLALLNVMPIVEMTPGEGSEAYPETGISVSGSPTAVPMVKLLGVIALRTIVGRLPTVMCIKFEFVAALPVVVLSIKELTQQSCPLQVYGKVKLFNPNWVRSSKPGGAAGAEGLGLAHQ